MRTLSIDIETYSPVDLSKSGVYVYSEHPEFEILLIGYSLDGGPVKVLDLTEQFEDIGDMALLTDPSVIKTAYNANFERTCLARWAGQEMPPEQWVDTMILAAELGLPKSLADVGRVIGLPEDKQKLKEGRQLIQYFCKPCKPTKTNGGRTRNLPRHDPEKWARFIEYNRQDVVTEMAIRERLSRFSQDEKDLALWAVDQRINDRGVMLDRTLAENAAAIDTIVKDQLREEAKELTGLANPNSNTQIRDWIERETGVRPESIDKKHIAEVENLASASGKVKEYINIRRELGKTSTAKYKAMLACVCEDDRLRGLTQFYGASRTGRWAGRFVQLQNLRRNDMPDDELDYARQLVRAGDAETLQILFDPADTLSQLIRTAFIPRPGCKFVVSDFSAIEARVLAWLAGEDWRLEVFRTHGKIYEASAEQMFHLPPGSVKKGDPMRQKGKIAELALGYGGSVGALTQMGALEMGLSENELKPLVDSWRAANPRITSYWWSVDRAVRSCIQRGQIQTICGDGWGVKQEYSVYKDGRFIGTTRAVSEGQAISSVRYREDLLWDECSDYTAEPAGEAPSPLRIRRSGPLMRLRLPSGREISYVKPKIIDDSITYEGVIQTSGGWGRIESYGPKFVENIVQAVARDCLAVSMRRLEKRGIPIVFHVHDEVICEVPEDGPGAAEIAAIMGEPISWAPGLPLKAEAYECEYYRKD